MAEPKKKQEPRNGVEEWFPEGATGEDDEDWLPEGVEGAIQPPMQAQGADEFDGTSEPSEPPLPEPIQVSGGETYVNRAANAIPLGRPLVDVGVAGQRLAAPLLGRVLPEGLARRLPGVVAGPGAKLTPQARAELAAMGEEVPTEDTAPVDPVQTYRDARDLRRARTDLGTIQNPLSSALGTISGIGLSAVAPLPALRAAPGASFLSRLGASTGTGAAYGALTGLTDGDTDLTRPSEGTSLSALGDLAKGTAWGAGLGAAAGTAIPAAQSFWRGAIKPSAEALYLRAKGVPLTIGQMNPRSWFAQIEEAAQSSPIVGRALENIRNEARQGWQGAVLDEVRPPDMKPLDRTLPVDDRLAQTYKGFDAAYAPTRNVPIEPRTSSGVPLLDRGPRPPAPPLPTPANAQPPAAIPAAAPATPRGPAEAGDFKLGKDNKWRDARGRFVPLEKLPPNLRPQATPKAPDAPEFGPTEAAPAFSSVVDDPNILATADERGLVRKFLDNQLTLAGKDAAEGAVSSNNLLQMRSNIREELSRQGRAQNFPVAQLLERAERELTDVIESSLPSSTRDALKAADRQYARYKTVEDAVARSGDQPDGFTPAQLSAAIRSSTERGRYARGEGGELRRLASAGREVLDQRVPPTGARILTLGPGKWLSPPFALWANTPTGQAAMLGQTRTQRGIQSAEDALARVLKRVPTEAAVREAVAGEVPEVQEPNMSIGEPARVLTNEQRQQLALSQAIQRLQGGRR